MRTTLSAISLATVCSVAALGAQSKPETAAQPAKPEAPVTISGCVAPGTAMGQFQLTHASVAGAAAEKPADAAKPHADATYLLTGGENLKAHVGHKVEVTGTLSRAGGVARMGGEKPPMAGEKPAPATAERPAPPAGEKPVPGAEKAAKDTMSAAGQIRGTVAVSAVKMVSTTCP